MVYSNKFTILFTLFALLSIVVLLVDKNGAIIDAGFGVILTMTKIGLIFYFVVMQIVTGDGYSGNMANWANGLIFVLALCVDLYIYNVIGRFFDKKVFGLTSR